MCLINQALDTSSKIVDSLLMKIHSTSREEGGIELPKILGGRGSNVIRECIGVQRLGRVL